MKEDYVLTVSHVSLSYPVSQVVVRESEDLTCHNISALADWASFPPAIRLNARAAQRFLRESRTAQAKGRPAKSSNASADGSDLCGPRPPCQCICCSGWDLPLCV